MRVPVLVTVLVAIGVALPALAAPGPTTPATPGGLQFSVHPAPAGQADGAGEPSIGINWQTGKVLYQRYTSTHRVTFDDASLPATAVWEDVTPPSSVVNIDPILFTDSVTGRTFAGGLDGACSILSFSDDDGETWVPMPNACALPSYDHQTIGGGPWRGAPPAGATHPHAVYYCAHAWYATCSTSLDGGLTFATTTPVSCGGFTPGLHGSVHVGPDGAAYLPFRQCGALIAPAVAVGLILIPGKPGVAVSLDNGKTWTGRPIPGALYPGGGFDPDVATTPSGWAYVAYGHGTGEARVALTKNHGATWTVSPDLGAPFGLVNTTFHEMVAGDDARAAVAFLGTTGTGDAFNTGFKGDWHLYVASTLDAGATWTTVRVTDDPVQRGCIWDSGGDNPCRNLLDFMDAQLDADGRILVAFADGCVGACALPTGTDASPKTSHATIARQACGPSLYAAKGAVEGARACDFGPAAPPVPTTLSGTYYLTGLAPVQQADVAADIAVGGQGMTRDAPEGSVPKVASNGGVLGGSNVRTFYDASWSLGATDGGIALGGPVTVRLYVAVAGGNTPVTVPMRVTAYLSDVAPGGNAALTEAFANQTATIPVGPTPTEVVLTFPAQSRVLANGLTLTVSGSGAGDVQVHYDAAGVPSRVEFG